MVRTSVDVSTLVTLLRSFSWVTKQGQIQIMLCDTGMKFQAANPTIRMSRSLPGVVEHGKKDKFQWLEISFGKFMETVKGLTGEVVIETNEVGKLTLSQGAKREYKMTGDPKPPAIEFGLRSDEISLRGALLRRGLHKALPFVSHDGLRAALCTIHVEAKGDQLVLYSSDGFTLCSFKMVCVDDLSKWQPVNLPSEFAAVVQAIDSDSFKIYQAGEGILGFGFDDGVVEGAVVVDPYPDIATLMERSIPAQPKVMVVNKSALVLSTKLSSIFSSGVANKMFLFANDEKFVTQSSDTDFGCEGTTVFGEPSPEMKAPALLNVNGKFLQSIIGVIDGDRVVLTFGDTANGKPLILKPAEQKDEELLFLLMPHRIDDWQAMVDVFSEIEVPDANIESVAA